MILVNDSYAHIKDIAQANHFQPVNGILLDLGYSSWQIEKSGKGFSFGTDEPLDMRYNIKNHLTAGKIVNEYPESELGHILTEYGEEKFARKIAQGIARERKIKKIETTFALKKIIEMAIPGKFQHGGIHCATRTFQALRIAVNGELDALRRALPDALELLAPGGRLVVISFHSLEDRIVKQFFKENESRVAILTKKPVTAGEEEIKNNPRSRSAKLRAVVKN
ncbi:MAG: 16S rRNA (cytosine(1402)-N(4))-methyltransferase RsmH, partial [Candidatus Paceibacterales bacterium]